MPGGYRRLRRGIALRQSRPRAARAACASGEPPGQLGTVNILYLCLQPLSGQGAADAHVEGIVRGLEASGHQVDVLASTAAERSLAGRLVEGLRVQLQALIRMRRADAAYVRMHPLAAFTVLFARSIPIVIEVNGVPEDFYIAHPTLRRVGPMLEALLRYQLRRADHVVTVTNGLAAWVETVEQGARSVHVVPNGADTHIFRPGLDRPSDVPEGYVLFFGELSPWQGIDLAITAATHPAWPLGVALVIIGDGHEAGRVEQAAREMPARILYLGARPRSEIAAYVSNALATVSPKRYHAARAGQSPLKLYESLAAGVPVLATPLAGATDIESLKPAVITVDPDAAAFATAVAALAGDPAASREMGVAGRDAILSNHTWTARAEIVSRLLSSASDQAPLRH